MTCKSLAGQHIKHGENAPEMQGVLGIAETPNPSFKRTRLRRSA